MPSSSRPYQSKLLRFVLQQWQQGLKRQQRAWQQLQSTAVLGAQIAVFPLYAVLRAVERASLTLGSSSDKQGLSPERPTPAKGQAIDINHSLTQILTHTQQLLSTEHTEQFVAKPQGNIIRRAQNIFFNLIEQLEKHLFTHPKSLQKTSAIPKSLSPQSLTQSDRSITSRPNHLKRKAIPDLIQNNYTLASVIKNRRLVLVSHSNEVFDIFTLKQQRELKSYIFQVITAYWQSRSGRLHNSRRLSTKSILTIGTVSLTALNMELRKTWSQLTSSKPSETILKRPSAPSPVPQSRIFPPHSGSKTPDSIATFSAHRLSSRAPDVFEANVNTVKYLEHPLERILRWIDRVLTWCEHFWKQWLGQCFQK